MNYERETTTFWEDFTLAEPFGASAIKDTYDRAMAAWKDHFKYLTELVMVLNHKCWDLHRRDAKLCELYADLFHQANDYAYSHLKGEELDFYFHVTD